ncbi:MAG: SUMF1/EgtB/PvdO family nonheme iron enzyme, partial [Nitrospinae bacterium]|nr:SUMF1/EgtB/PvdO family nonheme iron enzyme [Nitrospinota bacterium]
MEKTKAKDRAEDLKNAVTSGELMELSPNPMLLTTMAIIHQRDEELPEKRVLLYNQAVDVLLIRWQKRKEGSVSAPLKKILAKKDGLWEIMERLAYQAHSKEAAGKKGEELLRKDLLEILENQENFGNMELAAEFLDYVDLRAGLLVGQGGDEKGGRPPTYAFPHRTFKEYLAGRHMLSFSRGVGREYLEKAKERDFWYVAAKLGAEELLFNNKKAGEEKLLNLAYELCPNIQYPIGEPISRAALWSGYMAVILGKDTIMKDDIPGGGIAYLKILVDRLKNVMSTSPLGAIERADAGRFLAALGDPMDEVLRPEEIEFIEIPKGPFLMGSKESDEGADKNETPQETYTIPYDYKISRFPVTNAQYYVFVQEGGYKVEKYWTEARDAGVWKEGKVQDRDRPYNLGEPFNLANHPVAGVNWYEALAFCRWLTDWLRKKGKLRMNEEIRLPSEPEWEKAARGTDGRVYPWEGGPDPDKANYNDTKIGTTSAVGCFPSGKSPYLVEEMSGNVWEWTRSLWGKDWEKPAFGYPYKSGDGRENLDASSDTLRVLRGGAFYLNVRLARCAARDWNYPSYWFRSFGFRVIASPFTCYEAKCQARREKAVFSGFRIKLPFEAAPHPNWGRRRREHQFSLRVF